MNKYQLRHIFLTSFIVVIAFGSIVYTSGCKSKCGTVTCQNNGTCVDNVCSCTTGYSGISCETQWSTKFLGSYTCTQSCKPPLAGSASWQSTITVSATSGSYTISISNFGNLQTAVTATVDGSGNVTIAAGGVVAGSGLFADGVLKMHYTTSTNNVPGSQCDLTMVKN